MKTLLFDFDGVIANTTQIGYELQKTTCPDLTFEQFVQRFSGNIVRWNASQEGHTERCDHSLDVYELYKPVFKSKAKPYIGSRAFLEKLSSAYKLFVVSSNWDDLIKYLIQKYDLAFFQGIYGRNVDDSKTKKIKMILEATSVTQGECLFITDTIGDVIEAREAGIDSVAVDWGVTPADLFVGHGVKQVCSSFEELEVAIDRHFS